MGFLKYKTGVLNCSCNLNLPAEDVFRAPGLLDIIFRMTGSLEFNPAILYFSSQINFPEEAVY